MSFGGFGKESGPTGSGPRAQSTVQFPRGPSPSAPRTVSPGSEHTLNWGPGKVPSFKEHGDQTYQRSPDLLSRATSNNSRNGTPTEVQNSRTSSPNSTRFPTASINYMGVVPRAQAPQVYQNIYASNHRPRTQGVQQHSSIHPVWGGQLRPTNYNTLPPSQERLSPILTTEGTYKSGPMFQPMHADVPLSKQIRSPTTPSTTRSTVSPDSTVFRSPGHKRSLIDYRDLDAPEVMPSPSMAIESSFSGGDATHPVAGSENPFTSSRVWGGQTKSSGTASLVQETTPSFMTTRGTYQSGKTLQTKNATSPLPKRTRSPPLPSTSEGLPENPAAYLDANQRPYDFQYHSQSLMSGPTSRVEVAGDKSMQFPSIKRIKTPPPSSSNLVFPENLDPAQESERELLAKEKRLARFKDELSQPVQSNSMDRNQGIPTKRHHQPVREKHNFLEDPTVDVMADSGGGNFDNEGMASSSSVIVGLCPDMCPESERAERERKGDLDQYERVDGDRHLSSEFLAIKKYTRTAEREAKLIRPIPILQKTMDYLLNLLSEPYDDRFLGLYNFLWDRMRAIRMDLRMQHIFNLEAINMLEKMIRLHIIAMHELCEYTKGEGFAEGFDAHLNIEQMNKTSVELFQLYDDHRKKGIHVPSEREFRGYYALLKLDKHPGYKVEPAELSLDLAKMTTEIRQTPEVLFARDVARACRMGNFISFFRLANKASYLQGCLMHAHFSKLRTQALASLHSGLQINQGIPIAHVAKWLGMEEEDIDELLEYHGFSVKEFKEPYMMKESAFLNADTDFPIKRSKLVDRKRSVAIVSDVAFPSLTESYTVEEVPRVQVSKSPEPALTRTVSSLSSVSTGKPHDEEMHDLVTISSPKANMQQFKSKVSVDLVSPEEKMAEYDDIRVAPSSSPGSADNNQKRVDSPQKPKFESVFRNSFGRSHKQESEIIPPVTLDIDQDIRYPISPRDSVVQTPIPQPLFPETPEDEEQIRTTEEDGSDDLTSSYYDQEVYEAKLKLILRIWKRRTEKKKELREQKKLAASAAMSLLSMGPPMWQYENPSTNYSMFNIDHAMSERYELQERSSVVLNPSHVVAAKLAEKNPDAKYLCWKIVVCSLAGIPGRDDIELQHDEATQSWFQSKLMPANYDGNGDLVTSSSGLAIWRSWSPSLSGDDMMCCISVIRSAMLDNLNDSVTGTSAILFILSDYAPIEPQRRQLHDLVASLPSGSRLPLLIMDGSGKDESDTSSIVKSLGLPDIDKSRVIAYNIHFLKDTERKKSGGFLSDKLLREGLEWLASESPPQIVVNEIKTRELVLSYLNPALEILDEMSPHRVGPNICISAFNEALNRSMKEVTAAVDANPTGWPCPEIEMLNQSSDEYRGIACYLPSIGWSSASRTEVLMLALQNSILPYFEDDLSWLSRGFSINDDINSQTSYLENCLINYLTVTSQMMGVALAEKEARITLQKCARLELHDTTYHIIPQWVSLFRRIYNWRLMNLTNGEVFSAYVLQQHYMMSVPYRVDSNTIAFSPPYLVNPSLDELLDVGCRSHVLKSNNLEHEDLPVSLPVASCNTDALTTNDCFAFVDKENNDGVVQAMDATEDTKQADRLSELLQKCNIMQNLIDKKLSIYF